MRRFIHLAYNGTGYSGWQVQPGQLTVQGAIEGGLSTLLRRPVSIVGAGRTDTGVNARMMMAHFDVAEGEDVESEGFIRSLNSILGPGIAIYSIFPVADDAHARFDATARTYRYFAHTAKNPFLGNLSWGTRPTLDFDAMNEAGALMLGRRDFTSFSKLHTDVRTNICDLRVARWVQFEADRWYFEITADRFLRNMVRAVVGTLVEVGRHKIAPADILTILDRKDRCAAGTSMPPSPLFLWHIVYPYIKD